MEYSRFLSEQHRVAGECYHTERQLQFNLFATHVTEYARKIIDQWRERFSGERLESFITLYERDITTSLRDLLESYHDGEFPEAPQRTADEILTNHDNLDHNPQSITALLAEYPHPWMIQVRKEDFRLYFAMMLRAQDLNTQALQVGPGEYTPLNWNTTY